MPVKKKEAKVVEKTSKGGAAAKKAPLKAAVKPKAKKKSSGVDHVHIIERDFIIITSGGFLVIVMVMFLLFS